MELESSQAKRRPKKNSLEQSEIKIRKSTPDGESTSTEHNTSQQATNLASDKKIAKLLLMLLLDVNDRKLSSQRAQPTNAAKAEDQESQQTSDSKKRTSKRIRSRFCS